MKLLGGEDADPVLILRIENLGDPFLRLLLDVRGVGGRLLGAGLVDQRAVDRHLLDDLRGRFFVEQRVQPLVFYAGALEVSAQEEHGLAGQQLLAQEGLNKLLHLRDADSAVLRVDQRVLLEAVVHLVSVQVGDREKHLYRGDRYWLRRGWQAELAQEKHVAVLLVQIGGQELVLLCPG